MKNSCCVTGRSCFSTGRGATLVLRNDRERNYRYSTDGIHVERCSDLIIANFRIRAQFPSNTGYRVLAITPEHVDIQCVVKLALAGLKIKVGFTLFYFAFQLT